MLSADSPISPSKKPVSAYQVYAGIGFFVVLGAGFFEGGIGLSVESIGSGKIWQFEGGARSPLFKGGKAGMGNMTIRPLGKRLELSLSEVCFGCSIQPYSFFTFTFFFFLEKNKVTIQPSPPLKTQKV